MKTLAVALSLDLAMPAAAQIVDVNRAGFAGMPLNTKIQ